MPTMVAECFIGPLRGPVSGVWCLVSGSSVPRSTAGLQLPASGLRLRAFQTPDTKHQTHPHSCRHLDPVAALGLGLVAGGVGARKRLRGRLAVVQHGDADRDSEALLGIIRV